MGVGISLGVWQECVQAQHEINNTCEKKMMSRSLWLCKKVLVLPKVLIAVTDFCVVSLCPLMGTQSMHTNNKHSQPDGIE